jgi:hypothetical protein
VKYVVLKIAAGVFLGIVASLAVYKAFEIWEARSIAERYSTQQRLEAEVLKTRTAAAANNMDSLFPEKLFALCGMPLRDRVAPGQHYRYMEYIGTDGHRIFLSFLCPAKFKFCIYSDMGRVGVTPYDSSRPLDYETYVMNDKKVHRDYAAQIKELTCLIGLAELRPQESSEYIKRSEEK